MALKISLKAGERLFIGGAAIANGNHPCELTILNNVPILREREIMQEDKADTPCKRLYLTIQLMYMDPASLTRYQDAFLSQAKDILAAVPRLNPMMAEIGVAISQAKYYRALKHAQALIVEESKLLAAVRATE